MATANTVNKRRRRVLAIDDEPAMTEWLKMVIEAEGYEVRTALIGTRGEEIFKQWRPDVVVTDLMLPDLDGIQLLRRLKEIDPLPEIVVISGQGTISKAVEAGQAGAFYFLEKPVSQEGVLDIVRRAIERTQERAEPATRFIRST
jgi:DNA-binding NtrC family response regulator